ncbi:uncharacterized protein A1O9_12319 [Exophiala aquamarina CBS 119918]|uniref:Uncharacterized protein n=1 Tax=Exophiala aquamarina CBS 119918 TaxID=1182545 RepID=A0A072NUX6_9EURO|nr:uncharacterized protein A1O9_12319 [Exophiala aquamarina CBS 119918]KEF51684.1 hypothetical protein A1O9_12319 [Exophiala aquamarina CBS 119918]
MAPSPAAVTDGSKTWSPSHLCSAEGHNADLWSKIHSHLNSNEFKSAIVTAFELPPGDNFTYHASASVNLSQAEAAIHAGRANGLHAWYMEHKSNDIEAAPFEDASDQHGLEHRADQASLKLSGYPPASDIQAYLSLFDPTKSAANSLKSLLANAKKGSIRQSIAEYLLSKRYLDPLIAVPKFKIQSLKNDESQAPILGHENPALDFWAYACLALEYAGPNENTSLVKSSHHVLPIFMHHFGCVVPSYEALHIISKVANGKSVIDMGSGNGYWTLMLRQIGLTVAAVDSVQSKWRTVWIPDTTVTDGIQYLRKRGGCPDMVLLLVYPIVGGDFTRKAIESYTGHVICVAGTQNGNGYTGFKDMMIDEFMRKEKASWKKCAQVPLPSFAGKDDALFVFRRKKDADLGSP